MANQSLDVLQITSPCTQSWDAMTGYDQARFCTHCQKHVHDFSAMTTNQAEQLLCESAGSLCVRFQRSADGRVITLDYQPPIKRRRLLWPLTVIAAISTLAAGAIFARKPKPAMMMGMCPPISRPTTQPTSVIPTTQSRMASSAGVVQGNH